MDIANTKPYMELPYWPRYSKSFILSTYFNGNSTSTLAACSIYSRENEEEAIITK